MSLTSNILTILFLGLLISCSGSSISDTTKWTDRQINSGVRYQAVDALNTQEIWVSGTHGSVASSKDGGDTWTQWYVAEAESLEFRDIEVVSKDVVILLSSGEGDKSRLYKTEDGGKTWRMVFQNNKAGAFFDCVSFSSPKDGLAWSDSIDGKFVIVKTVDGGATWNYLAPEISPDSLEGEGGFAASGTCLFEGSKGSSWMVTGASGVKSHLIKLTGYGSRFERMETPMYSKGNTAGSYTGYYDQGDIFIFGGDYSKPDTTLENAYSTSDEGKSWTSLGPIPFAGTVYGSAGSDNSSVVVGPKGSAISLDRGKSWTLLDNINRWSVTHDGSATYWAVGPEGRVSKVTLQK